MGNMERNTKTVQIFTLIKNMRAEAQKQDKANYDALLKNALALVGSNVNGFHVASAFWMFCLYMLVVSHCICLCGCLFALKGRRTRKKKKTQQNGKDCFCRKVWQGMSECTMKSEGR